MGLGLVVFCSFVFAQPAPRAASLKFSQALSEFAQKPEFQSIQSTIRSINLDFESRDLLLQPVLELDARRINEHRNLLSTNIKAESSTLAAFLTKPFSTGTTLKLSPSFERAIYPSLTPTRRADFDWQISLSQDLWQDFLGRSTRLRRSRETFERRQQLSNALKSEAQLLIDFESLYWDWAMALRERDLRDRNMSRGQELLKWIRGRFARSAAENSDIYQAQALLAQRQLELSTVEQTLLQLKSRLQRFSPGAVWQPDPKELPVVRSAEELVTPWKIEDLDRIQPLELIAARNSSQASEQRALEAREQIRPTLSLQAAYGKNGLDPSDEVALRQGLEAHHEYSSIGVVFSSGLDLGLERKKVESARASRDSAKLHLTSLEADGVVSWDQLKQTLRDLQLRCDQAEKLAQLQWKKADAERRRYRLGRTTAFQVITFEQEAAVAEITLMNLYALNRKTEAQARLYAR